jgi:hypothetical protein
MNKGKTLIQAALQAGSDMDRLFRAELPELTRDANEIFAFAQEHMRQMKCDPFFEAALDYLDAAHFKILLQAALAQLDEAARSGVYDSSKHRHAQSILAAASVQFPEFLHDHPGKMFCSQRRPHIYERCSSRAWHGLSPEKLEPLKKMLLDLQIPPKDKRDIFARLAYGGNLNAVRFAHDCAAQQGFFYRPGQEAGILREAGFVLLEQAGNTTIEPLASLGAGRHIVFEPDYIPQANWAAIKFYLHPTWHLTPQTPGYRFGGILEADAKNPFYHLISLDPVPADTRITGLKKLILGLHTIELLSVGIEGVLCYRHDPEGYPHRIAPKLEVDEALAVPALKAGRVFLADTPSRWRFCGENNNRFGGAPDWTQEPAPAFCPHCQREMIFLLQVDDAVLPDINNKPYGWSGGGLWYAFWCDACKVSGFRFQTT